MAAILLLFSALRALLETPGASPIWKESFFIRVYADFWPAGIALTAALGCFGVGLFFDYFAQVAHSLRQLCEQNERFHFKPLPAAGAIPIPPLMTLQETDGPPRRFHYRLDNNTVEGPVDEAELQRLVNVGIIDHDTDVRAEGAAEWHRLEELAEP